MIKSWLDRMLGKAEAADEAEGPVTPRDEAETEGVARPATPGDQASEQPEDGLEVAKSTVDEASRPADNAGQAAPEAAPEAVEDEPGGFFSRLKRGMAKSREGLVRSMDRLFLGRKEIDQELLDDLEELLVMSDMGVSTVQEIFDRLRQEVARKELADPEALRRRLQELLKELFLQAERQAGPITWSPTPFVVLVVGVNGVGKTTTIAKLAWQLKQDGKKVLLVAADTFRAAAVDQLKRWGERIGVPVVGNQSGTDPSAVAFDGMEAAKAKGVDVVIVDTAGRLHTQVNLMEELKKIRRVMGRKIDGAPHEVLLVLDATTGQNALSQARTFCDATSVTGIVLTKLDGTAKGGIVASIAKEMRLPIRYIGIGEGMEDLRPFQADEFVKALFDRQEE